MRIFLRVDNEMLTDYIRYMFPASGEDGIPVVKTGTAFGELLIGHVRESERPVKIPAGDNVIELEIPVTNATQSLANRFIYYSSGDMLRLNAALKALFDIDLQAFYMKAEGLGYRKKDIIDAFIIGRGLVSVDPYDAIHKRVYRREQEKRSKVSKILLRKVYYIYESVDMAGLNSTGKR